MSTDLVVVDAPLPGSARLLALPELEEQRRPHAHKDGVGDGGVVVNEVAVLVGRAHIAQLPRVAGRARPTHGLGAEGQQEGEGGCV